MPERGRLPSLNLFFRSVTGQSLTEDPSKKLPRSLTYL